MKIECIIFDFDGTLFDSMYIWENVSIDYIRSLNKIEKPTLKEDVKKLTLKQSAQYLKNEYDLSLSIEQIMLDINQMIEHDYQYKILPKVGVIHLLNKIKSLHIPMCIVSATDRYLIESALKRCHILDYFDQILTCQETGYNKNQPFIYRLAINKYHAKQTTTLVFEDALHAIQTAKKDGFKVVGVYDSSEINQETIKNISDYYIEHFKEIEEIL